MSGAALFIEALKKDEKIIDIFKERLGEPEELKFIALSDENDRLKELSFDAWFDIGDMGRLSMVFVPDILKSLEDHLKDLYKGEFIGSVKYNLRLSYREEMEDFEENDDFSEDVFEDYLITEQSLRSGSVNYNINIFREDWLPGYAVEIENDTYLWKNREPDLSCYEILTSYNMLKGYSSVDYSPALDIIGAEPKLKLNRQLKLFSMIFDEDVELVSVSEVSGNINELFSELNSYIDLEKIYRVFKDMDKGASLRSRETLLTMVETSQDKTLEIRYYIEGFGFIWNALNKEPFKDLTIEANSFMMDKEYRGYIDHNSYHINNIVREDLARKEGFVSSIKEFFMDGIDYEEQKRYGSVHLCLYLDKGFVDKYIKDEETSHNIYFLNQNDSPICVLNIDAVKDEDLLMEKINEFIKRVKEN